MARDDDTFVSIGAYADEQAAGLDYEAVKELRAAHVIGSYDAAVIRKDTDGTVHVNKYETPPARARGVAVRWAHSWESCSRPPSSIPRRLVHLPVESAGTCGRACHAET